MFAHLTTEVGDIATGGIFWHNPIENKTGQTAPYIVFAVPRQEEDDIENRCKVEIVCFAKKLEELRDLTESIKLSLYETKVLNGNPYYMIRLQHQATGKETLENGYRYSILYYEVKFVR